MTETPSKPPSILCVDDDVDTCDYLAILFREFRFEAEHTIKAALSKLSVDAHNLYILDNWLPDGSGIVLCRTIRLKYPSTPILFTSGSSIPTDIDKALTAGADEYLLKPYEPLRLREIVKDLIYSKSTGDLLDITSRYSL